MQLFQGNLFFGATFGANIVFVISFIYLQKQMRMVHDWYVFH